MKRRCPVCRKTVQDPSEGQSGDSAFFPFCSQRCKLIDLGAWLEGDYAIGVAPDSEESEEPSDTVIAPPEEL